MLTLVAVLGRPVQSLRKCAHGPSCWRFHRRPGFRNRNPLCLLDDIFGEKNPPISENL
jgi:hypothetical protein